jgi:hypothetical protein
MRRLDLDQGVRTRRMVELTDGSLVYLNMTDSELVLYDAILRGIRLILFSPLSSPVLKQSSGGCSPSVIELEQSKEQIKEQGAS